MLLVYFIRLQFHFPRRHLKKPVELPRSTVQAMSRRYAGPAVLPQVADEQLIAAEPADAAASPKISNSPHTERLSHAAHFARSVAFRARLTTATI